MTVDHQLTALPSGVRIVTEAMPGVRSASLGFWIGTGSRAESDAQAGLSHLLEHLLFKGSERYESLAIDQIFDEMGAELNAGTGKETTSVYARVLDRHVERAFDVISDMIWRPAFTDVDSEREVVLEEIAMYEDDPQDKVHDLIAEAVFAGAPLGRSVIGRAEVIAGTPVDAIAAFHRERYTPVNVVVAAAGNIDHEQIVSLVTAGRPPEEALAPPVSAPVPTEPASTRFERKDTEQVHVCLGARGITRHDERRFALRLLDTIFGGSTASRLFQEVRENRGLAYAVYSYVSHFADTGQVGLYVGTRPDNVAAALAVVAEELERLRDGGVTEDELRRAKENAKGRLALSLESTVARMNRVGSSVLNEVPLLSVDDVIARIDAVTADDLLAIARELYAPEGLSAAGIGPDADAFSEALAPFGAAAEVAG